MIYLRYADLLHIAERALRAPPVVRDAGLLETATLRPMTRVFGDDAYPSLATKAAALTHSIARNHALIDGNKRLALAAVIAFLGINGRRLTASNDEAYDVIIEIATGHRDEIAAIATWIEEHSTGW